MTDQQPDKPEEVNFSMPIEPIEQPPEGFLWELQGSHITPILGPVDSGSSTGLGHVFDKPNFGSVAALVGGPVRFKAQDRMPARILGDYNKASGGYGAGAIVSRRFKELVESFSVKNVEFFPAEIEIFEDVPLPPPDENGEVEDDGGLLTGGRILSGFWWMNHWRALDVDREKTEGLWHVGSQRFPSYAEALAARPSYAVSYFQPPLGSWKRLVFSQPIEESEPLFGIKGTHGRKRYISNAFRAALIRGEFRVQIRPVPLTPEADQLYRTTYATRTGGEGAQLIYWRRLKENTAY